MGYDTASLSRYDAVHFRIAVVRSFRGHCHVLDIAVFGMDRQKATADVTPDLPIVVVVIAVQVERVAAG